MAGSEVLDLRAQQQRAADRFRDAGPAREATRAQQRATGLRIADSSEQLAARVARRFARAPEVTAALRSVAGEPGTARVLERVLAGNDQQGVAFLSRGTRAARTVGKISLIENGVVVGSGTGFLVASRLLLTNNHVLTDAVVAAGSFVEFDVELGADGLPATAARFPLDPTTLFVTDVDLDVSLVAVRPAADGRAPGERFGVNNLIAAQGKLVVGEAANLVGHPAGRPKEIAIRNNDLLDQVENFLHYRTDSEPGSSGSPVFNDQWEVVALHHAGVPSTDAEGNVLTSAGTRWNPGMGEDAIAWVANEGVRVSSILKHLATLDASPAERAVLDELGPQAVPGVASPGEVVARSVSRSEATGRTGLRAVPETPPHVVFLHGRSQQDRDPVGLRVDWNSGLARGLGAVGHPPLDPARIWFPYYGDLLARLAGPWAVELTAATGDGAATAAERAAPAGTSAQTTYAALIEDAAALAGFRPETGAKEGLSDFLAGVQPALSWLANRSRLDDLFIAVRFRDVALYLDDDRVRNEVLDTVLQTFPTSGPVTLVSHSLGTVVALDLLSRVPSGVDLRLLVTAGSPLGMDSVNKQLLAGGPRRPDVERWINAWCPADAVAIGSPLAQTWGRGVEDVQTEKTGESAHSIVEYLADFRVASAIGEEA